MTYKLLFLPSAKKEWNKLSHEIRGQFKKKLKERLENPVVPKDKLIPAIPNMTQRLGIKR